MKKTKSFLKIRSLSKENSKGMFELTKLATFIIKLCTSGFSFTQNNTLSIKQRN